MEFENITKFFFCFQLLKDFDNGCEKFLGFVRNKYLQKKFCIN